jgi:hypothetical protein
MLSLFKNKFEKINFRKKFSLPNDFALLVYISVRILDHKSDGPK